MSTEDLERRSPGTANVAAGSPPLYVVGEEEEEEEALTPLRQVEDQEEELEDDVILPGLPHAAPKSMRLRMLRR